jgi:hypothetical protein
VLLPARRREHTIESGVDNKAFSVGIIAGAIHFQAQIREASRAEEMAET